MNNLEKLHDRWMRYCESSPIMKLLKAAQCDLEWSAESYDTTFTHVTVSGFIGTEFICAELTYDKHADSFIDWDDYGEFISNDHAWDILVDAIKPDSSLV